MEYNLRVNRDSFKSNRDTERQAKKNLSSDIRMYCWILHLVRLVYDEEEL